MADQGQDENQDIFGESTDRRGGQRVQRQDDLADLMDSELQSENRDASLANIHTGSKATYEAADMAPPPEEDPMLLDPDFVPREPHPIDPIPEIDPLDLPQEAGTIAYDEEQEANLGERPVQARAAEEEVEEIAEDEAERTREGDGNDGNFIADGLQAFPEEDSLPPESLPPEDDQPSLGGLGNLVLDEDDLLGGSDGTGPRSLTQSLDIDFGNDGGGSVRLSMPPALQQLDLTSDGQPVQFVLSPDGQSIQGVVQGSDATVVEVRLNNVGGQYSYTFEMKGNVDHIGDDRIDLPVGITVTDSDGDSVSGQFNLGIIDDQPAAADEGLVEVEEGSNTVGSEAGGTNLLANDTLGADGGEIVTFDYVDSDGNEMTAFAGETVETDHGSLTVNSDGTWSFTANPNVDHGDGDVFDGFTYTVEDADGDVAQARQDIQITDDGPVVTFKDPDDPNADTGDMTLWEENIDSGASLEQAINIDFGADGEGSVTFSFPQDLEDMGLTAGGEPVEYVLSEDGQTIVATAGGEPVFTMEIVEDGGDFSYRFTLEGPMDHPDAGSDILSNLPFELNVTDGDGSTVSADIHVDVVDDTPKAVGEETVELEEGSNTVGSENGGDNLLANDDLGADGGTITRFQYTDEQGNEQWADAGDSVDTEHGQLQVNSDGTWTFTSDPEADHEGQDAVFDKFTYEVTDGDGDTSVAVQNIEITDDGPSITFTPPGGGNPPGGPGGPGEPG
ncbi:MAG: Ig-like domain-containing protein, partial [Magnetovibrionaceae bacterium]